jgi:hypothetical protein
MSVQLTVEQSVFLQGPVSINVAATRHDGWPCVCRAQGCMVAHDRRTITVLLSARRGHAVLDALDTSSSIAAVFSRPATHATLQFKSRHAARVVLKAAHRACATRYAQAFAGELVTLGYGPELGQGLIAIMTTGDLIALRFVPEIVFDQTPGPAAGQVLATA